MVYIKNNLTAVGVNLDELEKNLVVAAKQRLILVEMEKPSLAVIRGIICLAALINSNGDNCQAWLLLGLAVRMSEDSGLESWITEVEVPPRETDIDNFFEMLQADDPTFPTSFGWPKSGLSVIR
ncbi:hypothetical protein I316_07346 [Kwoniella heveanensis BCC8398]|uniref:Transcription factor domain-containing protein n=1 Tax=Kwoniella heveanensis BCC8398 TaxID=1296120 RepID=A0A1B9GIM7_9TREE|nr:hypothetical protein I316_07346 [Kwoniella heveanensis BCC8398]